jgi:hypothetical protein
MTRIAPRAVARLLLLVALLPIVLDSAEAQSDSSAGANPTAGITQERLDDARQNSNNPDLKDATTPDQLTVRQKAEVYQYVFNKELSEVGGFSALNRVGDAYAAAALNDTLFTEDLPDGATTIQRAVNRIRLNQLLEPIPENGKMDATTLAAYAEIAQGHETRDMLLDYVAEERRFWSAQKYGGHFDDSRIERFRFAEARAAQEAKAAAPVKDIPGFRTLPEKQ